MIQGMHGLFYTSKPEEAREFIAEKLDFDHVDAGDGWLIFDVPDAEVGVHPVGGDGEPHHGISFWCDDIESTVAELEERGVEFSSPVEDRGWGLVTFFEIPGGVKVKLYEPKHDQP